MTILALGTMPPANDYGSHKQQFSRLERLSCKQQLSCIEWQFSRWNDASCKRRCLLQMTIVVWRTILLQLAILAHRTTILALWTMASANETMAPANSNSHVKNACPATSNSHTYNDDSRAWNDGNASTTQHDLHSTISIWPTYTDVFQSRWINMNHQQLLIPLVSLFEYLPPASDGSHKRRWLPFS